MLCLDQRRQLVLQVGDVAPGLGGVELLVAVSGSSLIWFGTGLSARTHW